MSLMRGIAVGTWFAFGAAGSLLAQEVIETPLAPAEGEGVLPLVGPEFEEIEELPLSERVESSGAARVRVLDKITGAVTDIDVPSGGAVRVGLISIASIDCRYPVNNPAGNAYAGLTITYQSIEEPVFRGWMIASSPALNAMDHPRYDVWVLGCVIS